MITTPDGQLLQQGDAIQLTGSATNSPGTIDQAGVQLHSLPGTGWTEIAQNPSQWRNEAGDVETRDLYRVTQDQWWNVASNADANFACLLNSALTGIPVEAKDDFWICPATQFLPAQPGFQPPDLSDSIEWYSSIDNKLGEGRAILATLSPGTHVITAQLTNGDEATAATITVQVEAPAATPAPAVVATPSPQPKPQPVVVIPPAASVPAIAGQPNWLWLLILIAILLWLEKDKEKK